MSAASQGEAHCLLLVIPSEADESFDVFGYHLPTGIRLHT